MSPGDAHLARGRVVHDAYRWSDWHLEGAAVTYKGQFDASHANSLIVGGFGPDASAELVVSAPAVEASGIGLGRRLVVIGRTYVVTAEKPAPCATIYTLSDPNT